MTLKDKVLSAIGFYLLASMFVIIFLLKALMLSEFPVWYTLDQLKYMNIFIMTTSLIMFLLILFTRNYLKYTLSLYAIFLLVQTFITIRNSENEDINRLDQLLILMLLYPLIAGFFFISKKNKTV